VHFNINVTSASILSLCAGAALAMASAVASANTVTWNFDSPTGALGTSAVYSPTYSPAGPNTPTITAYGFEEQTTTGGGDSYDRKNSFGPTATDLYGKQSVTSESGLGISNDSYHEIDYIQTVTQSSNNWWAPQTIVKDFQSFVQIDLSGLLKQFGNSRDATITIGSLQKPDTAVLSYSDKLGTIGTTITDVSYQTANNAVGSATISLSDFSTSDPYLTISSLAPSDLSSGDNNGGWYCGNQNTPSNYSSSVLLGSIGISYIPSTPTPEPSAAGLLGIAAMGLMLIPRRRQSAK
jgi:hypothetical protein